MLWLGLGFRVRVRATAELVLVGEMESNAYCDGHSDPSICWVVQWPVLRGCPD